MNYTTWNGSSDTVSVASSRDLVNWTKHGPAFRKTGKIEGRSGVVVTRLVGDRLVAASIDGKYWMYYTHPCALAWSENLIDWTPVDKAVWTGHHEAGAIALLHDEGILLMFNTQLWRKPLPPARDFWSLGQAVVDKKDLTRVLKHAEAPFLYPEFEWENQGFSGPAVVANTLVPFKGRWLLYYGGADRYVGYAEYIPPDKSPYALRK
jgi:predicted GH43/DUF377 family glycosyl hydrolase